MNYSSSLEFAQQMDQKDPLKEYRKQFYIPQINGKDALYFTGNSLGLQPKSVKNAIDVELRDWANLGVEGHFYGTNPWFSYHEILTKNMAAVVGAKENEVVLMGSLSTNLHLLLVSFYQPKGKRVKIICEAKAFPSDQYILESHVSYHGLDPKEVIVEIAPRAGEELIREEDVLTKIEELNEELAVVMIGGVNYYTGQLFDMEKITKAAHQVGAKAGFDLAHAAGNINLKLHRWPS